MKNNIKILLVAFAFLSIGFVNAQVGVGTTTPDASAVLDVSSTTKGLLLPRLLTTERDAISLPATGLMIYNTTDNAVQFNSGTPASPVWTNAGGVTPYQNMRGNSVTFTGTRVLQSSDFLLISDDSVATTLTLPNLSVSDAGRIIVVLNDNALGVNVNVSATPAVSVGTTVLFERMRTYIWTGARWFHIVP